MIGQPVHAAFLEVHRSEQMPISAAGMLYSIDSLQIILQQSRLTCAQRNRMDISNIAHLPCSIRSLTRWRKQDLMHGIQAKESSKLQRKACMHVAWYQANPAQKLCHQVCWQCGACIPWPGTVCGLTSNI